MSAHESNKLLKYAGGGAGVFLLLLFLGAGMKSCHHENSNTASTASAKETVVKNMASDDSEAESLDTLTADLNSTKKQIEQVVRDNSALRQNNAALVAQLGSQATSGASTTDKAKVDQSLAQYPIHSDTTNGSSANLPAPTPSQPLMTNNANAPVLTKPAASASVSSFEMRNLNHLGQSMGMESESPKEKPKPIPFYTIPPNATAIHDRLMTALVGRIPVKGVVTDPYPFKIVFSDDTLAANGLRVPHLKQMIVSGFTEGDLNLKVVRGWVTSLTFVFEDGTISSTTSNDNNIGKFTKENALGYLTDQYGNPIQGTLITNAPEYLATKVGLGVASGFATAYAQNQVSNQSNALGGNTSTVSGSPFKFMAGQGAASGANEAQSWFDDRAENSFDAIYVPTIDKDGNSVEISVNFAKEIPINYDPNGRKINYDHDENTNDANTDLD